jgi:membrane-associated phospholipid phosphatase
MENPNSDEYSYQTQNFSGLWACALPLVWNLTQSAFIQSTTPVSLVARLIPIGKTVGEDLFILIQTFSWNGLMTELSHLISQRPRPFVYSDPKNRGIDPAHYTSFYSGHTSFTAAMNTAAFFILLRRQAPLIFLLISFACSQGLILSTAYFRILAGRHFLTDVLCGAIAGSIIAYFVVKRNLKDLTRWKF